MEYELIETKIKNKPTVLVIKDRGKIWLHSKYNPEREARAFVDKYYAGAGNYIIYGLGLGYHIEELIKKLEDNHDDYNIFVIESNENIYRYFLKVNKKMLDNKNIKIIKAYEEEGKEDVKRIGEIDNPINCIHAPSLEVISPGFINLKSFMEEVLVLENLSDETLIQLDRNFSYNVKNYDRLVNELFLKYRNVPMFLVSAGPSLDKNIKDLKKIKGRGIIVSVGRAVRALAKENIFPDYIVVTDPSDKLYKSQLKGLNLKIPIIILSTCDRNFMKEYGGEKYIALQKGYKKAEKYADKEKINLVETGGSVATTTLDIGIRMGCNPIIFVGQDLAYTNNMSHSKDSRSSKVDRKEIFFEVEDIYGSNVMTRKNLNMYRKWIERRIHRESGIKFYDASEGGALIRGTIIEKLSEVIEKYMK